MYNFVKIQFKISQFEHYSTRRQNSPANLVEDILLETIQFLLDSDAFVSSCKRCHLSFTSSADVAESAWFWAKRVHVPPK